MTDRCVVFEMFLRHLEILGTSREIQHGNLERQMLMSLAPWEISESDTVSLNDNNRLGVPKRHRFKTHGLFNMESKNEDF